MSEREIMIEERDEIMAVIGCLPVGLRKANMFFGIDAEVGAVDVDVEVSTDGTIEEIIYCPCLQDGNICRSCVEVQGFSWTCKPRLIEPEENTL